MTLMHLLVLLWAMIWSTESYGVTLVTSAEVFYLRNGVCFLINSADECWDPMEVRLVQLNEGIRLSNRGPEYIGILIKVFDPQKLVNHVKIDETYQAPGVINLSKFVKKIEIEFTQNQYAQRYATIFVVVELDKSRIFSQAGIQEPLKIYMKGNILDAKANILNQFELPPVELQ